MRIFILSIFVLLLSGVVNADYTIRSVYKFENISHLAGALLEMTKLFRNPTSWP